MIQFSSQLIDSSGRTEQIIEFNLSLQRHPHNPVLSALHLAENVGQIGIQLGTATEKTPETVKRLKQGNTPGHTDRRFR